MAKVLRCAVELSGHPELRPVEVRIDVALVVGEPVLEQRRRESDPGDLDTTQRFAVRLRLSVGESEHPSRCRHSTHPCGAPEHLLHLAAIRPKHATVRRAIATQGGVDGPHRRGELVQPRDIESGPSQRRDLDAQDELGRRQIGGYSPSDASSRSAARGIRTQQFDLLRPHPESRQAPHRRRGSVGEDDAGIQHRVSEHAVPVPLRRKLRCGRDEIHAPRLPDERPPQGELGQLSTFAWTPRLRREKEAPPPGGVIRIDEREIAGRIEHALTLPVPGVQDARSPRICG